MPIGCSGRSAACAAGRNDLQTPKAQPAFAIALSYRGRDCSTSVSEVDSMTVAAKLKNKPAGV